MEMLGAPRVTVVEGAPIAWTELGSGPPLVLLHGLGDSHRTWRLVAPRLAQHFRVLMLDLPGHGLSGRPDAPYTLEWYANTLLLWLDAAEAPRAHVIGHSFGGGIAQWMVLLGRERVDRLGLVSAGGLGPEVSLALRLVSFPALVPALVQPFMGIGTRMMMRIGGDHSIGEVARTAWMNSAPGTGLAFQRTVSGCIDLLGQHVQTWDRIHEIANLPPIALFWGGRDRILPIGHAHDARSRLEGSSLFVYPLAGHFPQLETPERFAADVAGFLRNEARSARLSTLPPPPATTVRAHMRGVIAHARTWIRAVAHRRARADRPIESNRLAA